MSNSYIGPGSQQTSWYQQQIVDFANVVRAKLAFVPVPGCRFFAYVEAPVQGAVPTFHFLLGAGDVAVPIPHLTALVGALYNCLPSTLSYQTVWVPPASQARDPDFCSEKDPERYRCSLVELESLVWFCPDEILANPFLQLLWLLDAPHAQRITAKCLFAKTLWMPETTCSELFKTMSSDLVRPRIKAFYRSMPGVYAVGDLPADNHYVAQHTPIAAFNDLFRRETLSVAPIGGAGWYRVAQDDPASTGMPRWQLEPLVVGYPDTSADME